MGGNRRTLQGRLAIAFRLIGTCTGATPHVARILSQRHGPGHAFCAACLAALCGIFTSSSITSYWLVSPVCGSR